MTLILQSDWLKLLFATFFKGPRPPPPPPKIYRFLVHTSSSLIYPINALLGALLFFLLPSLHCIPFLSFPLPVDPSPNEGPHFSLLPTSCFPPPNFLFTSYFTCFSNFLSVYYHLPLLETLSCLSQDLNLYHLRLSQAHYQLCQVDIGNNVGNNSSICFVSTLMYLACWRKITVKVTKITVYIATRLKIRHIVVSCYSSLNKFECS